MGLVKGFWKNLKFMHGNNPTIHCPTCRTGTLEGIAGTFKFENTADTKALLKEDRAISEWEIDFKFSSLMRCNNRSCKEVISCLGTGYYDQAEDSKFDEASGQYYPYFHRYYRPEYFSKAIHIIELKNKYPTLIKKALEDSFKLFFCDSESCANKIRVTVEVLMDNLKVKTSVISNHRRKQLTLHARILEYRNKNEKLADLLLAIKWIGNSGSHNTKISKDDTLDAYRILEYVLIKLFENDELELIKIANQINRMKKPLSQIRGKKK